MKFSKLLKAILGLAGLFTFHADGADGGGEMSVHSAADAFASLLGDDGGHIDPPDDDTPEAAAQRLADEEARAAAAPKEGDPSPDGEGDDGAVQKIAIKVDGKEVLLTPDEMAEHYKNGLRQADYTQKTMAAADARKAADAEVAQARQAREQYARNVNAFAIQTQGVLDNFKDTDWVKLAQEDPIEYLKQKSILEDGQAKLQQANAELNRIRKEVQQETEESQNTYRAQQLQELHAKLPEWKDPAKAKAESDAIKAYLLEQGFTAQKIESVSDAAEVVVHRKAMLYDALMEKAKAAAKKVGSLPARVERPGTQEGSNKPDGRTQALKNLAKTGSIDAAAKAFESFM